MQADVYAIMSADTGEFEAQLAKGQAEVRALTNELRRLANEAQKAGNTADSGFGQKMSAVGEKLAVAKGQVRETTTAIRETAPAAAETGGALVGLKEQAAMAGEGFASLRDSVISLAETFGVIFAVDAFKEWITSSADLGEKMAHTAAILGVSAHQTSQLNAVATLAGVSFDALTSRLARLQPQLAQAQRGVGPLAAALTSLGMSAKDLIGLPLPEQMARIADKMSIYADGANKTAIAQALLGRTGSQMLPILDRGRSGLERLQQVATDTGAVMSNAMVAAFADTSDRIHELSLAAQGFSNKLFDVMRPAIDAAITGFTKMLESMNVTAIRQDVQSFTGSAQTMAANIESFAKSAKSAIDGIITAVHELLSFGAPLANFLNKINSTANSVANFIDNNAKPSGAIGSFVNSIAGNKPLTSSIPHLTMPKFSQTPEGAMAMPLRAGFDAANPTSIDASVQDKPQAPAMHLTTGRGGAHARHGRSGHGMSEAAQAQIDAQNQVVKAAQDNYGKQVKIIDMLVATGRESAAQGLADKRAALEKEYQAELTAYEKEKRLAAGRPADERRIDDQILALRRKHNDDILNMDIKAAETSSKAWQKSFQTLNGAIDGQISGILRGTESLQQAFLKVAATIVQSVIKSVIDWGLKNAETTIMNISGYGAQTAALATSTAAQTGIRAAGAAAQKAVTLSGVQADAAKASSGAYAAIASIPIIGPALAPIAAAAAYAGTIAIASFDIGSWSVPSDMLARIHKNEMIVPASHTPWVQSMIANGGAANASGSGNGNRGEAHIHIHAMDTQGAVHYLHGIKHQVTRIVADTMTANPSMRPAY